MGRSLEPPQRARARRGDVERHDGALRHGRELHDAVRSRASARPSAKRAAARRRTRSSRTTFRKLDAGPPSAIFALAVPIGTSLGAAIGGWGNQHLGWRNTFIAGRASRASARAPRAPHRQRTAARHVRRNVGRRRERRRRRRACWKSCVPLAAAFVPAFEPRARRCTRSCGTRSGAFNNAFLQRSHAMTVAAGRLLDFGASPRSPESGRSSAASAADRLSSRAQRSTLVPVGAGNGHAHLRAVPVPRLSVAEPGGRAAVVRRPDVHGGGVLRAIVCDDAGARHAADAIGCDVACCCSSRR